MKDDGPVAAWAAWMRAGGRTENTIGQRTAWVRRLERETGDLLGLDGEALAAWAAGHEWGRATRRACRASLRSFYGWAVEAGLVAVNPADGLAPVREAPPCPRPVPEDVLGRALMEAGPRERLAILLGAWCGLRASEAAGVHEDDLTGDMYGPVLSVRGKGERERLVPCHAELVAALEAAFRESPHGWALPNMNDMTTHVSGSRVSRMCRPFLEGHTFHALRHRYASRVYGGSGDILATQRLLGHASPVTTQRYVATDAARLRAAAELAAA